MQQAPQASRPHMPGYGVYKPTQGKGLLPWSWAAEQLERSHNYWLATVKPDGRLHAMPVWGAWAIHRFYFSTGRYSRKARNLATNAHCVVTTESGSQTVIIEGTACEVAVADLPESVAAVTETNMQQHSTRSWGQFLPLARKSRSVLLQAEMSRMTL